MFLNFPLDYQTDYWIERAVAFFGQLLMWHTVNNHDNHARILVKVWIMSDALVPRNFVFRQMGGRRRSWTVPVYLPRTDQWNAHIHDLPVDSEDPPPADGNPHPFHGPHMTAEQRFQERLQVWLQQNGIFRGNANGGANVQQPRQQAIDHAPGTAILPSRGQVNYQEILRAQGVHFSDGVEPTLNRLVDSPMSAWNDLLSENSSSSMETLQIITGDEDVAESSAQGVARALARSGQHDPEEEIPPAFLIARAVLLDMQQPNIFNTSKSLWGAVLPPISSIKTFLSDKESMNEQYEQCEHEVNVMGQRVARKLCFDASPADNVIVPYEAPALDEASYESLVINTTPTVKRTRSVKKVVNVTTAVRRSPRNNIYKGFKVDMPTYTLKKQSKVKARVIPDASDKTWTVSDSVETPAKQLPGSDGESPSSPIPPPTPVPVLQKIGVNICGIPYEELEKDKLEKSDSDDEV
jgi:hypothetical protein